MRKSLFILVLLVIVSGCSKKVYGEDSKYIEENNAAAKILVKSLRKPKNKGLKGLLVVPFVALDKRQSTRFGMTVAGSLSTELSQRGVPVLDGRQKGEVVPIGASGSGWMAQLSGDYHVAADYVYISARIIRLESGEFVAAHSWTVPLNNPLMRTLLQQ